LNDLEYQAFLNWRDIEVPCPRCGGSGSIVYPSTATWRGGVGGCMCTPDVCDLCWGSGDTSQPFANLRKLNNELTSLRFRIKQVEQKLNDSKKGDPE